MTKLVRVSKLAIILSINDNVAKKGQIANFVGSNKKEANIQYVKQKEQRENVSKNLLVSCSVIREQY